MNNEWAAQQHALLDQHEQWVREQGGRELPVQLSTYFRLEQRARLRWLKSHVTGKVLDVGCSWGYVLAYVEGHAGVDINPQLVTLAQVLAPERQFYEMSATDLTFFANGAFETVILAEVLEHLSWPTEVVSAVREAKRVASERVLITLPAPHSPEAESFKHQWIATERKQAALETILASEGWGCEQDFLPGFVVYRCTY